MRSKHFKGERCEVSDGALFLQSLHILFAMAEKLAIDGHVVLPESAWQLGCRRFDIPYSAAASSV